jgi:alpha-D-xyloside xylohydrolase
MDSFFRIFYYYITNEINLNNMRKSVFLLLFACAALSVRTQNLQWTEELPGVWKATFGVPESYNLLSAAGSQPNREAIAGMSQATLTLNFSDIQAEMIDGKVYLRFPLVKEEQIFGLGLNFQTVHQRGKILNLHTDHYGGKDNGRSHAPVPFYVSSKGYGVLINSARYLTFYVGSGVRKDSWNPPTAKDRNTDKTWSSRPYSDAVEVLIPTEGVEIILFAGPTPLDVVRRYNLYCGGGCLPPRWGLGFTQRVQKLYNAQQVEEEAQEFTKRGYPLDFIGLEPGWQSKAYPCSFEWDKGRFPDPATFVKGLKNSGIRINLWMNPYISPESSIFKSMEPYTGSHTVWCGVVPDYTLPQAKDIFAGQLVKDQISIGVSGYKIDEVDGYDYYLWPDVARFPSGTAAEQMRQTYGVLLQKLTDSLYRSRNERTFGLVRASNAGANNLPYVIYNDYYSHQDFITALINSSFCGVLWTPEVRGSKTGEEWLRRFQSVTFSPMAMINAWSNGTKPWSFPEVADQVKYYAMLRMQLMPYFYTEFAKYHFEGTPPFRAMALEEGFRNNTVSEVKNQNLEDNPYLETVNKEVKDQYMAGEYLLVAPVFTEQESRKVLLPKGKWYDFYTGEYVGEGQEITVTPGLDKIPVYVKDGGIIPMMESRLRAPAAGEKINLVIRHYGEKSGKYRLYDDDGESFDYEKGIFSWREIVVSKNKKGSWEGTVSKAPKGKPDNIEKVTFQFMTDVVEQKSLPDAANTTVLGAHLPYPTGKTPDSWAVATAQSVMARWPDYSKAYWNSWTYVNGYMACAFERLYKDTGDKTYLEYIKNYIDGFIDEDGNFRAVRNHKGVTRMPSYCENLDGMMSGNTLVMMYEHYKDDRYKKAAEKIRRCLDNYPRNSDGGFWHGNGMHGQMWIDGIFMGQMFLLRYGKSIGDSEYAFNEAITQITAYAKRGERDKTGLYVHGIYEAGHGDRICRWADAKGGQSPEVWSEGLGWYALILVEALETIPENHPGYNEIKDIYIRLAEGLKKVQDPKTGGWYQVVDKTNLPDNWIDTSGSAMFVYAVQQGINLGILKKKDYGKVVEKGYKAITDQAKINKYGLVDIYSACDGLGVQDGYDKYINYKQMLNAKEAYVGFVWATEIVERERGLFAQFN